MVKQRIIIFTRTCDWCQQELHKEETFVCTPIIPELKRSLLFQYPKCYEQFIENERRLPGEKTKKDTE